MNYLVLGQDDYFVQEELNKLMKQLNVDPFNTTTYQCNQTMMENIVEDALTIGLFAEEKLVILEQPFFLTAQQVKVSFEVNTDLLLSLLEKSDPSIHVVIVSRYPKLDERKKVVKAIKKLCQIVEAETLTDQNFETILRKLIKEANLNINQEGYQYMVKHLEHDMLRIKSEIEKLSLYGKPITVEVLEKLMSRRIEDNVFLLVEAMILNQKQEALSLLNDLMVHQEEPIKIIVLVANQIRLLYQVKELSSQYLSQSEIAQYLGVHPYRVKLALNQVNRHSSDQLLSTLSQLASLDEGIKLGKVDKVKGLELFILRR